MYTMKEMKKVVKRIGELKELIESGNGTYTDEYELDQLSYVLQGDDCVELDFDEL